MGKCPKSVRTFLFENIPPIPATLVVGLVRKTVLSRELSEEALCAGIRCRLSPPEIPRDRGHACVAILTPDEPHPYPRTHLNVWGKRKQP